MSKTRSAHEGPFSGRAVAWMLGVGVSAFVALVALSAYAPELRDGMDGGAHALSRSAIGYAGLARLLRETGAPTVIARGPTPSTRGRPGILILTPPAGTRASAVAKIKAGRPVLIVLPKWRPQRDPEHPGWVTKAGLVEPGQALSTIRARITAPSSALPLTRQKGTVRPKLVGTKLFQPGESWPLGPVEALQTDLPDRAMTLVADEAGRPVLFRLDDHTVVLTEPDLLNNRGLRSQETAAAAVAILDRLRAGGPVVFDVTLNGFERSRSLLRLALGPPFLGATLCALAAALLMGVHAALRFGPTLRAPRAFALGKRVLVDNTAVLIGRARREARMGGRYAALTRRMALRGLFADREAPPEEAEKALDRLTPATEPPFSVLAAQAEQAKTVAEALAAARALHQRRVEMTRERL